MNDRPIDIEDPAEWPEWPAGDPRRAEFEARPSARARRRAYLDFMAAGDAARSPGKAEAESRLADALEKEIGIPGAARGAPKPPLALPARGPSRLKPLVAIAAVVMAAAGASMVTTLLRQQQGDALRGTTAPAIPGTWVARPEARATPNAGLLLTWAAAPGADGYTVLFISDDLQELDRVEGITGVELVLTREALPRGLTPAASASWRVIAFHGADEIGRSPATSVTLP